MHDTFHLGIIKVLTKDDATPDWLDNHGRVVEHNHPDIRTKSRMIPDQYEGIHDVVSQRKALNKIEVLARDFVSEGMDGILISCAADPAVDQIKTWCPVPVVGAGRPVALLALATGTPVGVLGLSPDPPIAVKEVLGDRLCGGGAPRGVTTANDLYRPGAEEYFIEPIEELIKKGARSIALACTGFASLGTAAKLSRRLSIPVVDPVVAAGSIIRYLMKAKKANEL
jgi:Asp/Glu/hydantoin racemase